MTEQTIFTTLQVAQELDITPQMVRRVAKRLNVGQQLGHDLLFTAADIDTLCTRNTRRGWKPGRPRGKAQEP